MLILVSAALAGCSTAGKSPRRQGNSQPTVSYNGADQDAINARANDLQNRGATREYAEAKAAREAEREAWVIDSTEAAKYERSRRAYQQQQDELNAGLHKLLTDQK